MFKKLKNQMEKVPSWQYRNNLISSIITFGFCILALSILAIYYFVKYSGGDLWWLGFIALAIVMAILPIYIFLIKWVWKFYKAALSREQRDQEGKRSLQEENEALKREIEELRRK